MREKEKGGGEREATFMEVTIDAIFFAKAMMFMSMRCHCNAKGAQMSLPARTKPSESGGQNYKLDLRKRKHVKNDLPIKDMLRFRMRYALELDGTG